MYQMKRSCEIFGLKAEENANKRETRKWALIFWCLWMSVRE